MVDSSPRHRMQTDGEVLLQQYCQCCWLPVWRLHRLAETVAQLLLVTYCYCQNYSTKWQSWAKMWLKTFCVWVFQFQLDSLTSSYRSVFQSARLFRYLQELPILPLTTEAVAARRGRCRPEKFRPCSVSLLLLFIYFCFVLCGLKWDISVAEHVLWEGWNKKNLETIKSKRNLIRYFKLTAMKWSWTQYCSLTQLPFSPQ